MATRHALDYCYGVRDHRRAAQRFIALAFALASVSRGGDRRDDGLGPLGEVTGDPAKTLGIEGAYSAAWSVVRWPIRVRARVGFLVCLYRFSANVHHRWRDLPAGGVVGAVLWISAAVVFRLTAGARDWSGVASNDPSVS